MLWNRQKGTCDAHCSLKEHGGPWKCRLDRRLTSAKMTLAAQFAWLELGAPEVCPDLQTHRALKADIVTDAFKSAVDDAREVLTCMADVEPLVRELLAADLAFTRTQPAQR